MIPILLLPAFTMAQQAPPAPTLNITTRLVYVDVVVRSPHEPFVRGLTSQDFQVLEDGKPQQIDFFIAHVHDPAASTPGPAPGRPASNLEFSNVPAENSASDSMTLLLFDLINTPVLDQLYARRQMLKFLKTLPPGQHVALFVLSNKLRMIQNVTGSSDLLVAAANALDPKDLHLVRSQTQQMQDADSLSSFAQALGRDPGGATGRLAAALEQEDESDAEIRGRTTMAAFADLARAVSGYPGRKNLLWISEEFPLGVGAQLQYEDLSRPTRFQLSDLPGSREAASLIASAQIAVYPISVLGLEAGGIGPESRGSALGGVLSQQFTSRQALRFMMEEIADQTGGEAFVGTNDLARAIRRSIEDGSNFYTLAYRPHNQTWNGQFRQIRVKLRVSGNSLSYRHGYFAFPNGPSPYSNTSELHAALQPESAESTMLLLKSKVQLPDADHSAVRFDSILDAGNVAVTTDAQGRKHAQLLVELDALPDSPMPPDQPIPRTSAMLEVNLDAKTWQSMLATGYSFHQELAVKPGKYRFRLGVSDMNSHRVGTLDIPIEVAAPVTIAP